MIFRLCVSALLLVISLFFPFEENSIIGILVLLVPYFLSGYDVLWRAIRNILSGRIFDENFLMAVATVGALAIGEYYEAVGVMIFYQTGELFQGLAVGKSRRSIAALMDIRPDVATVIRDGKELSLLPDEVCIGEIMLIRAGEKIALDGEIIDGYTTLNTSALTGESLPVEKRVGDKVVSGSVNLSGMIKVRVESTFSESTVSKILELVGNSASKKSKCENFITRFARYYTPCVVISALILAIVPPLAFGKEWSDWVERALMFLMVSCPCALVISVPLSFFGGIGGASRSGILIKGANYMEMLSKVDTVVFDKTGTLTQGDFSVRGIYPENDITPEALLEIAAYAESFSVHPVASALVKKYGENIDKSRVQSAVEMAGKGICAVVDDQKLYVGNSALMEAANVRIPTDIKSTGTIIHVCRDNEYLGYIVISDEIKSASRTAINSLKLTGIDKTVMLTGDADSVAQTVGGELGVDEIYSELFPKDKVDILEKILSDGHRVAFVGDGINDAPVLSRADVGIAMGAIGSDAAIEAADIVIMDDDPRKISSAIEISKKTMRIVKQNIIFALTVKGIILLLSAMGITNMWFAVFGDVGVMVIAILNAMRAMKI